MKKLTFSSMATARLRANKKGYISLAIGIFLAIFLVTTSFLGVQGVLLAQMEKTDRQVGKLDAFLLDDSDTSDEKLMHSGYFSEIGHVTVSAIVKDTQAYVGYYDEIAQSHLYRTFLSGRMPDNEGEIAVEYGTLMLFDNEKDWQVGDTLELTLLPIDGLEEKRTFILVGILQDQSEYLGVPSHFSTSEVFVKKFPAMLTSEQEPVFASGRVAIHRTLLTEGGFLAQANLSEVYKGDNLNLSFGKFYGISIGGNVDNVFGTKNVLWMDQSLQIPLVLGILLATSLILSCCVGISSAMEGLLSRRSEEIGILRAVGATKRQIRRMFGRESILLAIILSPISILLSIGAVYIASLLATEDLVLSLNPWLLIPIAVFSLILIFLSGYLPLRRCSNQMPMSVIRDTAVLRKVSHIKSAKQFRVQTLISRRMLRLNPGRQVGAMILSGLMLFSMACVSYAASMGIKAWAPDSPAFEIRINNNTSNGYVRFIDGEPMSDRSLAQIRALPHVSHIEIERNIDARVLLPEESTYLNEEVFGSNSTGKETKEYLDVDGYIYPMYIQTVILDSETLSQYNNWVEDGKINVDAINAGHEVIVAAPRIWNGVNKYGDYSRRGPEQMDDSEVLAAENDCFHAGQTLQVYQLYAFGREWTEDPFANAVTEEATVTVGAVLNDFDGGYWSTAVIITTEQGIHNMGLYANGMDSYSIYLDGEIGIQTEQKLVERIEAIAARSECAEVNNYLESHRENVQNKQQLLTVFGAITLVFLSVSVSMIVTSNTRRIQSDGRLIGMLRAVGAEEKTILNIYTGQVTVSIAGGFMLTLLAFWFMNAIEFLYLDNAPILWGLLAMAGMAALSWIMCRFFLHFRIREVINKSIIDNIREL